MSAARVPHARPGQQLTDVEIETLAATAAGLGNAGTARKLGMSIDAVKCRLCSIYVKLGALDRSHAVALGFSVGYLWVALDRQVRAGRPGTFRAVA